MNLPEGYQIVNDQGIYGFFSEYRFLSNFHLCDVVVDGILYPSSEHAYLAYKTDDVAVKQKIADLNKASEAKKMGQEIVLRYDWEYYRVAAMLNCLHIKFKNRTLAEMLLDTGDKYLEETNWWKDKFWGVYKPVDGFQDDGVAPGGLNMLGKCLMMVRSDLRDLPW